MKTQNQNITQAAGKLLAAIAIALTAAASFANAGLSWDGNSQSAFSSDKDAAVIAQSHATPNEGKRTLSKGRVLVILSSENKITLKDGKVHPTGFFFPELIVPLQKLIAAGYVPVFANPEGDKPVMDAVSDSPFWFGDVPGAGAHAKENAAKEYRETRQFCRQIGICGEGLIGTRNLNRLSDVVSRGLDAYAGVFLPGGHAPMEDLWKNRELGTILRYFHASQKPTGLICHAPIALLSALDQPEAYMSALSNKDAAGAADKVKDWIYRDYSMTVFTTPEEQQEEPGQDNMLGGFVQFYADDALENAGARVSRASKWTPNVVASRELITGQNPFSHEAFGDALVNALNAQAK